MVVLTYGGREYVAVERIADKLLLRLLQTLRFCLAYRSLVSRLEVGSYLLYTVCRKPKNAVDPLPPLPTSFDQPSPPHGTATFSACVPCCGCVQMFGCD